MKQFTSIFLILIYFAAFTGTAITTHYCMGEYQSMAFFETGNNTSAEECPNCGMENKGGCCDHHTVVVKAESNVFLSNSNVQVPDFHPELFTGVSSIQPFTQFHKISFHNRNVAPPEPVPLFIFNCTYRI